MVNLKRTLLLLVLSLDAGSIYADIESDNSTDWGNPFYTKVITLTGGPAFTAPGQNQNRISTRIENVPIITTNSAGTSVLSGSIPITRTFINTYQAQDKNQVIGTGEAFFALQWQLTDLFKNQLGLAIGGTGSAQIQGEVNIDNQPSGSMYSYNISSTKVVVRDKLLFIPNWNTLHPFLTGSFGTSFNVSNNFYTHPLIDINDSAPFFENKTQSFSYTYSIGLGIQKDINYNWNISLGYEFADLGKSMLGAGNFGITRQTLILDTLFTNSEPGVYDGPSLSHLHTHNLLFSVSYTY